MPPSKRKIFLCRREKCWLSHKKSDSMKIVLLNPPGDRLYIRSYYCGAVSKSNYLFQPLDLLMLSGSLYQEHEITVIDCIAERLSPDKTIQRITASRADIVICVVSIVSWKSDLDFLYNLKRRIPSLVIIANGDVFFEEPHRKLEENDCMDAIIFDFISSDIIDYLKNDEKNISNMLYKKEGKLTSKKTENKNICKIFSIPTPRHELFLNKNYRFPFVKRYPFTTVLTSFGCPFKCSFCIANKLGFRYRKVSEVLEELYYISKLGIKEIFFEDMSFGLPRENITDLCSTMIKKELRFGWTCFSRVDIVDYELLSLMKKSGCHTIIFGVESASQKILDIHHKSYTKRQIINTFKICRELDIRTVATFILGLPEETRETCRESIRFAKEIDCDYASFNIAVPRPGTELRRTAIKENLIRQEQIEFDHSGMRPSMPSRHLSKEELVSLKKKATRDFYLRAPYIFKKLAAIKSFTELREHIRGCIGLLFSNTG